MRVCLRLLPSPGLPSYLRVLRVTPNTSFFTHRFHVRAFAVRPAPTHAQKAAKARRTAYTTCSGEMSVMSMRELQNFQLGFLFRLALGFITMPRDVNGDRLLSSVADGNIPGVELLISTGVNVNYDGVLGNAANAGQLAIARLLLDAGADVNLKDARGDTALMRASLKGHVDLCELFLDAGADMEVRDMFGGATVVQRAVAYGKTDVTTLLLDRGADMDARDMDDATALLIAATKGRASLVEMLVGRGADVNAEDRHGETALLRAAVKGHADIITMLLDAGAVIDHKSKAKDCAFLQATAAGNLAAAETLLVRGCKRNVSDGQHRSALMLASTNNHPDVVTMLCAHKVDSSFSHLSLLRCAHMGLAKVCGALVAAGVNRETKTKYGNTALMVACNRGHYECARTLLEGGCKTDPTNLNGDTALTMASTWQCAPVSTHIS